MTKLVNSWYRQKILDQKFFLQPLSYNITVVISSSVASYPPLDLFITNFSFAKRQINFPRIPHHTITLAIQLFSSLLYWNAFTTPLYSTFAFTHCGKNFILNLNSFQDSTWLLWKKKRGKIRVHLKPKFSLSKISLFHRVFFSISLLLSLPPFLNF